MEEIDSARLQEFPDVLAYYEKLQGAPVKATFHLVFGNEKTTNLPKAYFDRIIMANVFHEIEGRIRTMICTARHGIEKPAIHPPIIISCVIHVLPLIG